MTRWLGVLLVFAACGGSGDDDEEMPSGTPQPTEIGTPIGAPVTLAIGSEGGTLVSADGAATLVVPPGALATATDISIQQITNHAWASNGNAYRLTPDGLTFATPAELRLAYDPAQLVGTAPSALAIAYQTIDRFWAVLRSPVVEADHVSVALEHFTDYSMVEGFRITADDDSLQVKETTVVRLSICHGSFADDTEPFMVPCTDAATSLSIDEIEAEAGEQPSVNGVLGGDTVSGTLSDGTQQWTYKAPASVPPSNPVAVSVRVANELLVTNITILGGDDIWTGTSSVTIEYTGPAQGFANLKVTSATVTWTFDEELGAHVPTGTVEYMETGSYDNPPGPPCQVTASYTGPIDPASSSLVINPGMYAGIGAEINVPITTVDTCQGSTTFPTQLVWMPSKQGTFVDDVIDFSMTSPAGADSTQTVTYHYEKQ